jgi:hypothetical protein
MNTLMMDRIFNKENVFYNKLKKWYGKFLDNMQVSILHVEESDGEVWTVIFILKDKSKIEIVRIFTIGDNVEISIDLQTNTNDIGGIRKLIQYGGNFKKFEIEDFE